jgi:hypothetical protein
MTFRTRTFLFVLEMRARTTVGYFCVSVLAFCVPNCPISADHGGRPTGIHRLMTLQFSSDTGNIGLANALRLRGGSTAWGTSWNAGSSSAKKLYNPENDIEVYCNPSTGRNIMIFNFLIQVEQPPKDGITSLTFSPKVHATSRTQDGEEIYHLMY